MIDFTRARYVASSFFGFIYLFLNALLLFNNTREARSHYSYELATIHTVWRLVILFTQVSMIVIAEMFLVCACANVRGVFVSLCVCLFDSVSKGGCE